MSSLPSPSSNNKGDATSTSSNGSHDDGKSSSAPWGQQIQEATQNLHSADPASAFLKPSSKKEPSSTNTRPLKHKLRTLFSGATPNLQGQSSRRTTEDVLPTANNQVDTQVAIFKPAVPNAVVAGSPSFLPRDPTLPEQPSFLPDNVTLAGSPSFLPSDPTLPDTLGGSQCFRPNNVTFPNPPSFLSNNTTLPSGQPMGQDNGQHLSGMMSPSIALGAVVGAGVYGAYQSLKRRLSQEETQLEPDRKRRRPSPEKEHSPALKEVPQPLVEARKKSNPPPLVAEPPVSPEKENSPARKENPQALVEPTQHLAEVEPPVSPEKENSLARTESPQALVEAPQHLAEGEPPVSPENENSPARNDTPPQHVVEPPQVLVEAATEQEPVAALPPTKKNNIDNNNKKRKATEQLGEDPGNAPNKISQPPKRKPQGNPNALQGKKKLLCSGPCGQETSNYSKKQKKKGEGERLCKDCFLFAELQVSAEREEAERPTRKKTTRKPAPKALLNNNGDNTLTQLSPASSNGSSSNGSRRLGNNYYSALGNNKISNEHSPITGKARKLSPIEYAPLEHDDKSEDEEGNQWNTTGKKVNTNKQPSFPKVISFQYTKPATATLPAAQPSPPRSPSPEKLPHTATWASQKQPTFSPPNSPMPSPEHHNSPTDTSPARRRSSLSGNPPLLDNSSHSDIDGFDEEDYIYEDEEMQGDK